jgi:hypothetical protein
LARVVDEAVLYHLLHPEPEVRRCAFCSKWFEAEYRGRARFCGTDCRKRFAALGQKRESFRCALKDHDAPLADFSGLSVTSTMDARALYGRWQGDSLYDATASGDHLWMCGLVYESDFVFLRSNTWDDLSVDLPDYWTCAQCVHKSYPQWRTYIAPVTAVSKKGSAQ